MGGVIRRRAFLGLTFGLVGSAVAAAACRPQLPDAITKASVGANVPGTQGLLEALSPTPTPAKPNFFSTSGSSIVDAEGRKVLLTGVNWFGMETGTFAPHGLWVRKWQEILDLIVSLGYNTIRLPFSNAVLDPNCRPLEGVDFNLNADLRGLNGLELMDKIVVGAGERGLKIILDRHRPTPNAQSKLWYTDEVSEEQWIKDWQSLAQRYQGNDTVIGADLHNEPAGEATWGTGDEKTDWRLAAERAGNAILSVNPDWLIIVEGIEKYENDWYWMGGSLQGAASAPVRLSRPDKLVYSAHDYGPGVYDQGWFKEKDFPRNMPAIWEKHWAYLVKQEIAPVLLGEFGGRSVSESDTEGIWQRSLIDYLKEHSIHYTYWCINPNSGDTGGILQDDWKTVDDAKQKLLASYQGPPLPIHHPSTVHTSTPVAERKNPLPEVPVAVVFNTENQSERTNVITPQFKLLNRSISRVPLENLELRYWIAEEHLGNAGTVKVDWASVDDLHVELVASRQGEQTHQIVVTFGPKAGMLADNGTVEIKLRLQGTDDAPFDQSRHYSFQSATGQENDKVVLYFWGQRIWGNEPTT